MTGPSLARGKSHLIVVALVGVAVSGVVFGVSQRLERLRAQARFYQNADQQFNAAQSRVTGSLDTIRLLASHFEAVGHGGTSRRSFSILVAPALVNHHYLKALAWVPLVQRAERSAYERLGRADGFPRFGFIEMEADGSPKEAPQRDWYFPTFYREPLAGNEQALGFNIASSPVGFAALQQATDTGRVGATARVELFGEKNGQYGIVLLAPVYSGAHPETATGRRNALEGFANAVIRIAVLFEAADDRPAQTGAPALLALHVFDMSAEESQRQLYPRRPEVGVAQLTSGFHAEREFAVGERVWLLVATPGPGYADLSSDRGSALVGMLGLAVTGVLVLYLGGRIKQSEQLSRHLQAMQLSQKRLEKSGTELEERVRLADLGTEIGVVMTQSESLRATLKVCAEIIAVHLDVALVRVWTLRPGEKTLELEASAGMYTNIDGDRARVPVGAFRIGRIAKLRLPVVTNAVSEDPDISDQDWIRKEGMIAFSGYPLLVDDRLLGVVAFFARRTFTDETLRSLGSVADQIALGVDRKWAEEAQHLSEERFRMAAEGGNDVVWEWDMVTNQVRYWGSTERLLDPGNEMPTSFRAFADLTHPDDRDRVAVALRRHLENQAPFQEEYRIVQKGGAIRHWFSRGSALRDAAGRPYRVIGVVSDITKRKQTEAALALQAAIVESSDASVISMQLDGTLLTWNAGAERIYGYSWEEIRGCNVSILTPPEETRSEIEILNRIAQGETVERLDMLRMRKDGKRINLLVTASPLLDSAGRITGGSSIAWDITERKELERQLAQAQKLESIGQLAAGIAHEINTPVQYVGDNTRFLRDAFAGLDRLLQGYERLLAATPEGPLSAEIRDLAQSARLDYLRAEIPKSIEDSEEGVARVAQIVKAMKEFSHPGSSGKTALDMNRAIESTILVCCNEWKYVAEMQTDLDTNLPAVHCVPGEFNQVILNLIVNAAHAIGDVVAAKPGSKGNILVSTRHDGDWAEIRVRDSGSGIPEAARPHVFNPFFTTKPVGKGTGQGLAISHTVIVQKHGGSITFDTDGAGTTFIVRIPIADTSTVS